MIYLIWSRILDGDDPWACGVSCILRERITQVEAADCMYIPQNKGILRGAIYGMTNYKTASFPPGSLK